MFSTLKTEKKNQYDPAEAYDSAMKQLQQVKANLPAYDDKYEQSLRELYQEIADRPKFSYDPNGDALYQSYKQSYAQQGRLAMEDAMGQAAGLTGGYGSSYAQTVGQQQYGAYLQKLSDVFPETYGMAYRQYLDEGSAMESQYTMLSDQADRAYEQYLDRLAQYNLQVEELQNQADTAYDRGKAEEETAYDRGQDTLDRQEDAYDRLSEMVLTMGYTPDASELRAAGMSEKQLAALLNYYSTLNAVPTGGGGKKKTEADYEELLTEAQSRVKKSDVETVNGDIARMVEQGKLDVDTARQLITDLTRQQFGS